MMGSLRIPARSGDQLYVEQNLVQADQTESSFVTPEGQTPLRMCCPIELMSSRSSPWMAAGAGSRSVSVDRKS